MSSKIKIMKFISRFLLIVIVFLISFLLLINFNVISFNSSSKPEAITLSQREIGIKKGDNYQLVAFVLPTGINHGKVKWSSSDESIAIVNEDTGYITALKQGITTISASVNGDNLAARCTVNVTGKDIAIENIDIINSEINLAVNSTYAIKYNINPLNATIRNFLYTSSDTSIAVVDTKGNIKGINPGKAIITMATRNTNIKDTVIVNVYKKNTDNEDHSSLNEKEETKIIVSNNNVTVNVGGTITITKTVTPSTVNQNVTWTSSNNNIATVSDNGVIKGISEGTTKIILTSVDGKTAIVNVKVNNDKIALESINIKEDIITIPLGTTKKINVTFNPTNTTDQSLTFTSSAESILKVSNEGVITPISTGTAIVTATSVSGGYRDYLTITVSEPTNNIPITSISFPKAKYSIFVNSSIMVNPTILPENATNKKITWTSSNRNIATIDDGLVYGLSSGTCVITATSLNKAVSSFEVTVNNVPVTGVTLNIYEATMNVSDTLSLISVIVPDNATIKEVFWQSDNENIVKVNNSGIVTAIKSGTALVTVKTLDGNFQKSVKIKVN